MPKVRNMNERFQSHLARVGKKQMDREVKRVNSLYHQGRISNVTCRYLVSSAPIRLAYQMNAG